MSVLNQTNVMYSQEQGSSLAVRCLVYLCCLIFVCPLCPFTFVILEFGSNPKACCIGVLVTLAIFVGLILVVALFFGAL